MNHDHEHKSILAYLLQILQRTLPFRCRGRHCDTTVPPDLPEEIYLQAILNHRRMPDSLIDFLEIERRPVIQVAKDIRRIK